MSWKTHFPAFLCVLGLALAKAAATSDTTTLADACPSRHVSLTNCKCWFGEPCFPSFSEWIDFSASVDKRLILNTPLGTPCHWPFYDEQACQSLSEHWTNPAIHYESSSSVMAPFFANQSCDPWTTSCSLGNYAPYSVNVSKPEHVSRTLKFAAEHNLRVVIRNTGHDYLGKSTGRDSIAIWTHHLKSISFLEYQSEHYNGTAIKIGAGVQAFEAYAAANACGLSVVGGECPTVGLAGGYTQGGGHSALSSKYGLAADQALEWEVIDAQGNFLTASPTKNADLYWALSGGGGGTFGVVWSLTAKVHPDVPTSGLNLTFANNGDPDTFYEAIGAFVQELPAIVDAGVMVVWVMSSDFFAIAPATGPDVSAAELRSLFSAFTNKLVELGIPYNMLVEQFTGYLPQFETMMPDVDVGVAQYGGRLIPRTVALERRGALMKAYRSILEGGAQIFGVGLNASRPQGAIENAVHPAWRDTLIHHAVATPWNFTAPWSEMLEWQRKMTEVYIPALDEVLEGTGIEPAAYLNEADFREEKWKDVFYGPNYERLRQVKRVYDPNDMFYATTAVGADDWEVTTDWRFDGKLCKRSEDSSTASPMSNNQMPLGL